MYTTERDDCSAGDEILGRENPISIWISSEIDPYE